MVVKKKLRLKIWIPVLVIGMLITGCGSGKSENKQESFGTVGKDEDPKVIMEKVFDKLEAGEGYETTGYQKYAGPESISEQGIEGMYSYDMKKTYIGKSIYKNQKYYDIFIGSESINERETKSFSISNELYRGLIALSVDKNGNGEIDDYREPDMNEFGKGFNIETSYFNYMKSEKNKDYFDIKKSENNGNIIITVFCKDLVGYLERENQNMKKDNDIDLYSLYPDMKYTEIEDVYTIDKEYNLLKHESNYKLEYTPELISESYMTQVFEYKAVNLDTDRLDSIMTDVKTGKLKKGDTIDWKIE